jgi:hypothetical protein
MTMSQIMFGILAVMVVLSSTLGNAEEVNPKRQGVEKYLELRSQGIIHREALKTVLSEFKLTESEIQAEALKVSEEGRPADDSARKTASNPKNADIK